MNKPKSIDFGLWILVIQLLFMHLPQIKELIGKDPARNHKLMNIGGTMLRLLELLCIEPIEWAVAKNWLTN